MHIKIESGKVFDTKDFENKIEGGIFCSVCGCRLGWTEYESSESFYCDNCAADIANGEDE